MHLTRPVAVATLAATALTGGIGGALLLGTASAGTGATAAPQVVAGVASAACGEGFAEIAGTIGISTDDLRAALRDGQTLGEVAEANGADPQAVVDLLVAGGTERLDAAVAAGRIDQETADERAGELPAHAAALVDGELDGRARRHPRTAAGLRTTAETIGISTDDLRAALRDGQTVAQVAEANGVDPQAVVDALVSRSTDRITRVVNGETARSRC